MRVRRPDADVTGAGDSHLFGANQPGGRIELERSGMVAGRPRPLARGLDHRGVAKGRPVVALKLNGVQISRGVNRGGGSHGPPLGGLPAVWWS